MSGFWREFLNELGDPTGETRELHRLRAQVAAALALHRPVKFTDVSLGIRDAQVCARCHVRLDCPDHFTEEQADAWEYPLVQESWPCKTVQALTSASPPEEQQP